MGNPGGSREGGGPRPGAGGGVGHRSFQFVPLFEIGAGGALPSRDVGVANRRQTLSRRSGLERGGGWGDPLLGRCGAGKAAGLARGEGGAEGGREGAGGALAVVGQRGQLETWGDGGAWGGPLDLLSSSGPVASLITPGTLLPASLGFLLYF